MKNWFFVESEHRNTGTQGTVDASAGTSGLQFLVTSIDGNYENSFGINANFSTLTLEFEYGSAVVLVGTTTGTYTTVGVNLLMLMPFFVKAPVGQPGWKTVPVG